MKKVILLVMGILLLWGTTVLAISPILVMNRYNSNSWPEPGTEILNRDNFPNSWPEPGTGSLMIWPTPRSDKK